MRQPLITVITPNLNQAPFLERAICSVLDQGYENLEYIIVDGGSTDGSDEILKLYKDDLSAVIREPSLGPADAINKALARATGQIIAILNADDLYLPGTLHAVSQQMHGSNNVAWLVGACVRIGAMDQMLGTVNPACPESFASFLMHDSGLLPISASFFRRELFEELDAFDNDLELAYDYEFACRLMAAGIEPTLTTQTLTGRREHPLSRSAERTLGRGVEQIAAAHRYADHLSLPERYALWRNCDERERIYTLARAEMQGDDAKQFLLQQLLRRPWWLVDDSIRQVLRYGIQHPVPASMIRAA